MSLKDKPFFASLPAEDIERAKRWYEEKLALNPDLDLGFGGLVYQTGGISMDDLPDAVGGDGQAHLGGFVVA